MYGGARSALCILAVMCGREAGKRVRRVRGSKRQSRKCSICNLERLESVRLPEEGGWRFSARSVERDVMGVRGRVIDGLITHLVGLRDVT